MRSRLYTKHVTEPYI